MIATCRVNTATILVVDDNNLHLALLSKILSKANFKIIGTTLGIEAIERAKLQHPDLILLDVMMGDLDGF